MTDQEFNSIDLLIKKGYAKFKIREALALSISTFDTLFESYIRRVSRERYSGAFIVADNKETMKQVEADLEYIKHRVHASESLKDRLAWDDLYGQLSEFYAQGCILDLPIQYDRSRYGL